MIDYTGHNLKVGTVGGTLCVIMANIQSDDIIKTVILSMTGALVSFVVSFLLKKLARWRKRTPRL